MLLLSANIKEQKATCSETLAKAWNIKDLPSFQNKTELNEDIMKKKDQEHKITKEMLLKKSRIGSKFTSYWSDAKRQWMRKS